MGIGLLFVLFEQPGQAIEASLSVESTGLYFPGLARPNLGQAPSVDLKPVFFLCRGTIDIRLDSTSSIHNRQCLYA